MGVVDIQQLLNDNAQVVNQALERYLPEVGEQPTALAAAMRYAVSGGKRVRPLLTLSAARAWGLAPEVALPTACGLELLHCATLVHDDLPCIDNSDLRHGLPTCHLAFDEATAVLAADALIIMAFELLARQADEPGVSLPAVLQCIRELAEFTGPRGLIVGEALDIETEHRSYTESELEFIHLNKTAKLIICAARSGAILAGAPAGELAVLTDYAQAMGLLFQITDDLLDVEGEAAEIGKPVGADAAAGKATYPGLLGLTAARQRAHDCAEEALIAARQLPGSELWLSLAEFIVTRRK